MISVPPTPIIICRCSPRSRTLRAAARRPCGPSWTAPALRHGLAAIGATEHTGHKHPRNHADSRGNPVSTKPGALPTPTFSAIAVFEIPSAASNTIRARCANPARTLEDRVNDVSRSRSPSRNPNGDAARFAMPHSRKTQPSKH